MKNQIRYFIILCLVVNLIFVSFIPTYACGPIYFYSNYWYKLDYNIANDSLPSGVTAVGTHPPYVRWTPSEDAAVLGQLEFTNENDSRAYIVPDDVLSTFSNTFSDHVIEPNTTLTHSTLEGMRALMQNPQYLGGAEPLPPPFLYEPAIIQDNQLYTIPITVSYSVNPYYEEDPLFSITPFSYFFIDADAVVLGEVIGVGEDAYPDEAYPDSDGNAQIYGDARIQVEEWLLGDGPAEIEVGHFVPDYGGSCYQPIEIGERAYFLLRAPNEPDSIRYQLTSNHRSFRAVLSPDETVWPDYHRGAPFEMVPVADILQELAESTATTPTASPTTDEPGVSIFLPYISR